LTPTRTVLIGGPSNLTTAINNLRGLLANKLQTLQTWAPSAQRDFKKWFGSTDEAARQTMIGRIDRMQKLLDGYSDSNFKGAGRDNTDTLFAQVYQTDDQTVYLGNLFATAPDSGTDSQAGALGHEMYHFNSVGGTDDHVYGPEDSKALAKSDPAKALQNADSFEYYLEDAP
jgi:peptidyl-Lys metalloendopeptidase